MNNPDHRPVFVCAGSCSSAFEACDLMWWRNCELYCIDCRLERIDDGDMVREDFTKFVPDHVARIAELEAENAAVRNPWRDSLPWNDGVPEHGKYVLVRMRLSDKDSEVVFIGYYLKALTSESDPESDCEMDYCEKTDTFYDKEGWYERLVNWGEYASIQACMGEVVGWAPIPTQEGD